MRLSDLAKETGGKLLGGDAEIGGLCTDSRVACENDLFLCFSGTRTDPHDYAEEAVTRGAAAIVCEREVEADAPQLIVEDGRLAMAQIAAAFYGHPERKLSVVGVTGTNGKTTVSSMLYEIFTAAGKRAGVIGTLGARYGSAFADPALTTPDPVDLFSLFAEMVKSGVQNVAMEVSAHALSLKKEAPIVYDAAIFTNLTQDHLDFFGTMQKYGEAKRSLFTAKRCRLAVLNADDAFSATLKPGGDVITYGLDTPADCFALTEEESAAGSRVLFNLEDELCEAELKMVGRHNVYNALAAAATAHRLGIPSEAIARGLSRTTVNGRLERVGRYHGAEIFVDFAHTPDGLEKSLAALREYCEGRLVLLFGCGGDRDREKRPIMGEIAAKNSDFSVITSDNPRYEDPCAIIGEIEEGFRRVGTHYTAIEERERATGYALSLLAEGDILLVAGKGGETTQEIMGIKYAYDDKDVIKALIEDRDA